MIELLKLCGFEANEIDLELSRVERAFNKLSINAEDIERGKQRLNKYYDIELKGVRKILRLILRELVDCVLAREEGKEKILTGFMSPGFNIIGTAVISKSKDVYSSHPSGAFQIVLGSIFDKIIPVLEAAEERWLKSGLVSHCGNVKTIVGLIALDLIPKPDLLVTSGYMCDLAPHTINLLHEFYDIPIFSCDTCQDREFNDYHEGTQRTIALAAKNQKILTNKVQNLVDFEITDTMISEVRDTRMKFEDAALKLREIIESGDPTPISATHHILWAVLSSLTLTLDSIPEAVEAIDTLCEELQERIDKGVGVTEKGAPRVLLFCPPSFSDPRSEHLFTQSGLALISTTFNLPLPEGTKPAIITKDVYEEMAINRQNRFSQISLRRRIIMIKEGINKLNIAGLIDRYHLGCRNVAGDALIIQNEMKKLGIPVLLTEGEDFDPRNYDEARLRQRIELFKTMMVKK